METETTEQRLEKLERTTRRYRFALMGMGIAVLACVVIWVAHGVAGRTQAQNPGEAGKVIRASEFILVDENGNARARLSVLDGGPGLALIGENGKSGGCLLAVFKDGPRLVLGDEKGKIRACLSMKEHGPSLFLSDENGEIRAHLAVGSDGPGLTLCDENGQVRAGLDAFSDGPGLLLTDENSKGGVMLAVRKGRPELNLLDMEGNTIWQAPH